VCATGAVGRRPEPPRLFPRGAPALHFSLKAMKSTAHPQRDEGAGTPELLGELTLARAGCWRAASRLPRDQQAPKTLGAHQKPEIGKVAADRGICPLSSLNPKTRLSGECLIPVPLPPPAPI